MSIVSLICKELIHRKLNFLLSVLAIATAVAFFITFFTAGEASNRETTRLMRDIGYNLRIIPKETDMNQFWTTGFSDQVMPEEYVNRFVTQHDIYYNHLKATLHKKVQWQGHDVLLTGITAEVAPIHMKKPSMTFTIEPGTVYVGYELAQVMNLKQNDTIDLLGQSFTIVKCLPESGSIDDIRIFGELHDVQKLLNMEGRINEIEALECHCYLPGVDSRDLLREQLTQLLPEAKVIQIRAIAKARENQRRMVEGYFALILPFVVVVCAIWIGALAMLNTRERRQEIGIMRALGYGSAKIAALFLGKAILVGIIGAIVGFYVGTGFSLQYGPKIFQVTAKAIQPIYSLLVWALFAAPAFAALSAFIPAMIAVTQDPAETLRAE
ncbi:MAG: FtsX-like permease family protein [Candidatus Omnitrophota bacterium]|jgi:ABC-type lipoprotein release transport system permease subunit|nr:MAG: FtsX-like permease family protein [Candidatus Omnitrophota bacterium]